MFEINECVHGRCCGVKSRVTGWHHGNIHLYLRLVRDCSGGGDINTRCRVLLCCCCAVGWTTYMLLLMRLSTAPRARGVQVWLCCAHWTTSDSSYPRHTFMYIKTYYTYDLHIFSFLLTSTTYILQILAEFLQILQKLVAQL